MMFHIFDDLNDCDERLWRATATRALCAATRGGRLASIGASREDDIERLVENIFEATKAIFLAIRQRVRLPLHVLDSRLTGRLLFQGST